jgi:O-antigen/teichoic acid export membrane protein
MKMWGLMNNTEVQEKVGGYEAVFIAVGRVLQFALALVIIRIATNILSPVEMGRMGLVTATTALFSYTLVNPVGMFINRRLHTWRIHGRLRYNFRIYWAFLVLVAATGVAVVWLMKNTVGIGLNISMTWILILVGGSLVFNTCNATYIPSLNLMGYPRGFIVLTIATLLLGLSLSLILTHICGACAEYWLLGLLLGQLVVGLVGRHVFFRLVQPIFQPDTHEPARLPQILLLFAFAWPLSLSVGLNWVQYQSYRFIVQKQVGLAQLGLLVTGCTIGAGIIIAAEQILTTYFQPRFYRRIASSGVFTHTRAWNDYASAIVPSIIITDFVITALAPELTRILAAQQYQSASRFVVWGALAESARVLVGVYSLVAHARMRTRILLFPNAIGACSSLILVYFLVSRFGAKGAVMGLAAAGAVSVVVSHGILRYELPFSIPIKRSLTAVVLGMVIFALVAEIRPALMHYRGFGSHLLLVAMTGLLFTCVQWYFLRSLLVGISRKTGSRSFGISLQDMVDL